MEYLEVLMKESTRKITFNYFYNLSFQIFSLLVPLLTTPYISRVLGAEMIGIYSYTLSISTYFIVAGSLGFSLYGQREIAYCANDIKARSMLFFQLIKGQVLLLTVALTLYYLFVIFYVTEYKSIYFAQSIGIVGGVLATSWFYFGIEEFKVTVAKNFLIKIISVAGLFLFVKNQEDVVLYAGIIGGANVIGNAVILVDIKKYVDFKYFKSTLREILTHVKPAFILGIPYYITSVYAIIDKTMLGILGSGFAEVGYYEQSQKIVTFVMAIVTSLGTVMMPKMAQDIGSERIESVKRHLNKAIEVSLLLAMPISAGLVSVASMIVPWFFGADFDKVAGLLIIFAPLTIIMGVSNLLGSQYMVAAKKEKELTLTILIGVSINCFFNALLIPQFDSYGAAAATIISEMIKTIIQIHLVKLFEIKKFILNILKYGMFSIIMGIVLCILRNSLLTNATVVNTMLMAVCGAVIYGVILIITKNSYVYSILTSLYQFIRKRK